MPVGKPSGREKSKEATWRPEELAAHVGKVSSGLPSQSKPSRHRTDDHSSKSKSRHHDDGGRDERRAASDSAALAAAAAKSAYAAGSSTLPAQGRSSDRDKQGRHRERRDRNKEEGSSVARSERKVDGIDEKKRSEEKRARREGEHERKREHKDEEHARDKERREHRRRADGDAASESRGERRGDGEKEQRQRRKEKDHRLSKPTSGISAEAGSAEGHRRRAEGESRKKEGKEHRGEREVELSEKDREHRRRDKDREHRRDEKDREQRKQRDKEHHRSSKGAGNADLLASRGELKDKERAREKERGHGERRERKHEKGERKADGKLQKGTTDVTKDQEDRTKDNHSRTKSEKVKEREAKMLAQLQESEERGDEIDETFEMEEGAAASVPKVNVQHDDDDIAEEYADESFEDYEDDFEEEPDDEDKADDHETERSSPVDNKILLAVSAAISAENRAASRQSCLSVDALSADELPPQRRPTGRFLDFAAAKKKQVNVEAARRTQQRGQELLQLLELDVMAMDLFEMAPQSEYDVYIKQFGKSNTEQVGVQCNEDRLEQEAQTDDIELTEKWCQHPPEDMHGCGAGDEELDLTLRFSRLNDAEARRLAGFIQRAGQVVSILLEENLSSQSSVQLRPCSVQSSVSQGYVPLQCQWPLLKDRHVICCHLSLPRDHLLLTAYSSVSPSEDPVLEGRGVVGVWSLSDPVRPQRLLMCQSSSVLCCCFHPTNAMLAFAGTSDGSVVLWDFREPHSAHSIIQMTEKESCVCHRPTYSTDGVSLTDTHCSPVVDIVAITSRSSRHTPSSIDTGAGISFQLASLDEHGTVHVWVVVELQPQEVASETELGLSLSGCVKLVHSATIPLLVPSPFDARLQLSVHSFAIRFQPGSHGHFVVGSDTGKVLHGVRYKKHAIPRYYEDSLRLAVDVTSIDFSPWQPNYFLAGCADGCVRLHHISRSRPLVVWTQFASGCSCVTTVRWAATRPGVFFVADTSSQLLAWDLLANDRAPIAKDNFSKHGRITCMEVLPSGDSTRPPEMALAFASGELHIHRLSSSFSQPLENESAKMADCLKLIT